MSGGELTVALDVSAVPAEPVGAGQYTLSLARALVRLGGLRLVCYARGGDAARWGELGAGAADAGGTGPGGAVAVRPVAPGSRPLRLAWGELGLGRAVGREVPPVGVLHGPHYTMPARSPVPVVVTVHDLTFRDHPEWHERSKVVLFRRALSVAARRADLVLCVSGATARRFVERCSPRAPVEVVPHGVDHDRFGPVEPAPGADEGVLGRLGVEAPYLVHLGTIEPRKGLVGLLSAFERVAGSEPGLSLVLVGREGWGTGELDRALATSPVGGRVRRLGYVPDQEVPALLRQAAAVVYPSLEEGFGLPALEALACGAPLVTTEGSVMAETAGGAALLAPPGSPGRLAEAIEEALGGGPAAAGRRERGLSVAAGYTWEASAAAHLAAYRRVAG